MTSRKKKNDERKTTYVVTEDLSLVVCRWCELKGIPSNELKESNLFADLLDRLGAALRKCSFDEQPIEVVTLQRSVFDDLLKKRDLVTDDEGQIDRSMIPEKFWVALDNVYPTPLLDNDPAKYNISITRYVDSGGKEFEAEEAHGPRPEDGDENLRHQVRACVNKWDDAKKKYKKDLPIVLVDDGTFTGETICQVLTEFANQHVIINSVRLGVAKRKGIDLIAGWRPPPLGQRGKRGVDLKSTSDRKGVLFIGASNVCPPLIDWVCERDFFPGVMYGGKVVAKRDKDGIVRPLRVGPKKDIPVRSQYLYGWGNPNEWASIQEDEQRPFTLAVLKLSIKLWTQLQSLAGRPIKVQDLPAIPSKLFYKDPKEMNTMLDKPWIEVLEGKHKKLEDTLY